MRVAFVQTYPLYHDHWTTDEWLALEGRDRWMPGIASAMGHQVELWAIDEEDSVHVSRLTGFGDYRIKLFARTGGSGRSKFHFSNALVEHARKFRPDVCFLKGIDGGAGAHLAEAYLKPERRPFALIIGGKYYTPHVRLARAVFFETEAQRKMLERPSWRLWRRPVSSTRLLRLPKSVDTERFRPMPEIEKEWDVLSVGRLVPRLKDYSPLAALGAHARVAVVGGGPMEAALRTKYPGVIWIGRVLNSEIPTYLNRARLLVHTSVREFFPRVLAEAAACGVPAAAYAKAIASDVLPPECGIRLPRARFAESVLELLANESRLASMSMKSRDRAISGMGKYSSREALELFFNRTET
jgi:glycosyltransferase involved in cell wall biosynthesis